MALMECRSLWGFWLGLVILAACSDDVSRTADGGRDGGRLDARADGPHGDGTVSEMSTGDGGGPLEGGWPDGPIPDGPAPDVSALQGLYVGPAGDDNNPGTAQQPLKTFKKALALWQPGKEIRALGGTFTEQLAVSQSGTAAAPIRVVAAAGAKPVIDRTGQSGGKNILLTGQHILVEGFEVRGSSNQCVDAAGKEIVVGKLLVHDCESHGVIVQGQGVTVRDTEIHTTVLENKNGTGGGWGSALKIAVGADGVTLERNKVYHNWGEGIALTRGKNITVRQCWSYDNWSVNIYVDNSLGVTVERNLVTCTANSGFEKDGSPPTGIAMNEEYYQGWGAQLADVVIGNNIVASCKAGVVYWGSDVPNGGMKNVKILHNTLYDSEGTALSIAYEAYKTQGSEIANNLIQQPAGKVAWIEDPAGISVHHNFWVGTPPASWTNAVGTGDLSGDPKLAFSPGLTAKSYRLSSASPARDAAQKMSAVPLDFEGRTRSTTSSPGTDMGAMEYGPPGDLCAFDQLW